MKYTNSKIKSYAICVFFIFCFAILPGILLFYGIKHLDSISHATMLKNASQEISQFYKEIKPYTEPDHFWCNFISDYLNPFSIQPKVSKKQIKNAILEIEKKVDIPYILYDPFRKIFDSNFTINDKHSHILVLDDFYSRLVYDTFSSSKSILIAMGKIFGAQVSYSQLNNAYSENRQLVWTDSRGIRPLLYVRAIGLYLVVFYIKPELLESNLGLKIKIHEFCSKTKQIYSFVFIKNNKLEFLNSFKSNESILLSKNIKQALKEKRSILETNKFILFPRFLTPKISICTILRKTKTSTINLNKKYLIIALYLLLAILIVWHLYGLIILKKPDRLPIKWKLRILFSFANTLPLLVLFYLGLIFLAQERGNLLAKKLNKGIKFLQNFDQKFETVYAKTTLNYNKSLNNFIQLTKREKLTPNSVSNFIKQVGDIRSLYMIASQSKVMITQEGLIDIKHGIIPKYYSSKSKRHNGFKSSATFAKRLGRFFLGMLNHTKITTKDATEIELLIESFTQKSLTNFMHQLLQMRGKLIQFGFGNNINPVIIATLLYGNPPAYQYFAIGTWDNDLFQRQFLRDNTAKANRNSIGLKIITCYNHRGIYFTHPYTAKITGELRDFASQLTKYPSDKIKLINYKNKQYLAMGFNGNRMPSCKLMALYPVSVIDAKINKQRYNLILFALASLLITFTLSQLLAHSLLIPLAYLADGAKAIEEKKFTHRLPNLGFDEFGRMGTTFNEVMPDLEELSVARAIQEQLLPQHMIPTGSFSLYGKSVSMSELGGDYFDYMTVSNDYFGVLLGDVAGHGVGASLIMAMAKAGIVLSDKLLSKPQELSLKLHQLILASRTKQQKKIMTFQYLYMNKLTGIGSYSNAGACSPILVNPHKKTTIEISLAGPALGAFKKAKYSQIDIKLEPDEALIFYTDGIVETRNSNGKEIGYDNMKKMYLECWSKDAEKYYNNIFERYLSHLGDARVQDDLTIVILVKSKQLYTEKQSKV